MSIDLILELRAILRRIREYEKEGIDREDLRLWMCRDLYVRMVEEEYVPILFTSVDFDGFGAILFGVKIYAPIPKGNNHKFSVEGWILLPSGSMLKEYGYCIEL